jgi:hypothetical protein
VTAVLEAPIPANLHSRGNDLFRGLPHRELPGKTFSPSSVVFSRLLNDKWLSDHLTMLLPFYFRHPLHVGRPMPWRNLVQGKPLRLHPLDGVA